MKQCRENCLCQSKCSYYWLFFFGNSLVLIICFLDQRGENTIRVREFKDGYFEYKEIDLKDLDEKSVGWSRSNSKLNDEYVINGTITNSNSSRTKSNALTTPVKTKKKENHYENYKKMVTEYSLYNMNNSAGVAAAAANGLSNSFAAAATTTIAANTTNNTITSTNASSAITNATNTNGNDNNSTTNDKNNKQTASKMNGTVETKKKNSKALIPVQAAAMKHPKILSANTKRETSSKDKSETSIKEEEKATETIQQLFSSDEQQKTSMSQEQQFNQPPPPLPSYSNMYHLPPSPMYGAYLSNQMMPPHPQTPPHMMPSPALYPYPAVPFGMMPSPPIFAQQLMPSQYPMMQSPATSYSQNLPMPQSFPHKPNTAQEFVKKEESIFQRERSTTSTASLTSSEEKPKLITPASLLSKPSIDKISASISPNRNQKIQRFSIQEFLLNRERTNDGTRNRQNSISTHKELKSENHPVLTEQQIIQQWIRNDSANDFMTPPSSNHKSSSKAIPLTEDQLLTDLALNNNNAQKTPPSIEEQSSKKKQEKFAGGSWSNSPPPSSLPTPSFTSKMLASKKETEGHI